MGGGVRVEEGYNIGPLEANLKKKLVNKNEIKPKIGNPHVNFGKNLSYPLPWIFNPCASIT